MKRKKNRMSVSYEPREIIQDQLLVALGDKTKVAILATTEDLDILEQALHLASCARDDPKFSEFLGDLRQLRKASGL